MTPPMKPDAIRTALLQRLDDLARNPPLVPLADHYIDRLLDLDADGSRSQ